MLMLSLKDRLKILSRIAQQTNGTLPQNTVETTAVVAPPPSFVASQIWGWLGNDYSSTTLTTINNLISLLNTVLHYSSNGQFNFQILRNEGFQVDPSGVPSIDTKNLINLSLLIYRTFLNNGNRFPQKTTPHQIATWCDMVANSQAFLNLSQLSPTGIIAQKVPGNLKDNILNFLRYLEMANPVQQ